MNKKVVLLGASVFMLIGIFVMLTKLYKKNEVAKVETISKSESEVFNRVYAPRKGSPDARVIVTEFLDPECESCRGIASFVEQLLKEYEGKIQLVIRYAPFHPNSRFAVKILEGARKQGKYWETLEVLYRHQPEWGDHHHPRPDLIWTYLPEAGLDRAQLEKDMEDPAIEANLQQDIQDGETLGVRATPTFFVNGKPLEDFGPQYLREAIEREVSAN